MRWVKKIFPHGFCNVSDNRPRIHKSTTKRKREEEEVAWNEITGAFEEFSDQVDVLMENETTISNIDGDIPITVELETEGRMYIVYTT